MDTDQIWDLFRAVTRFAQSNAVSPPLAPSSVDSILATLHKADFGASSSATPPVNIQKINDHVYEVSNLSGRRPSLELIFFHGLQLEGSQEPHLDTWLSQDGSELWLIWILEKIRDARIVTVSYDAHEKMTDEGGRNDMYVTTENLLHDLVGPSPSGAQVGQVGCPVVLVGHCIGGLVMKQLCVYAGLRLSLVSGKQKILTKNFLNNIQGLFFYATPHLGTRLADMDTSFIKGQLFQGATTLNTEAARRNEDFCRLCKNHEWKTFAIGENCPISMGKFRGLFVPEASARLHMDEYYTVAATHNNVCRPESPSSSSFCNLLSFIGGIMDKAELLVHECQGLPYYPVQLESRAQHVEKDLVGGAILGICGMGGIGKTTLAKKLFNNLSKDFPYTCFVDNVKGIDLQDLGYTILEHFYHEGVKLNKGLQWSQLKNKKVLLVMDDVDSEEQLTILPGLEDLEEASCLIMTSRNREVFKFYGNCKIYEVELLQANEAMDLFCKHAFGLDRVPKTLTKYVTAIVEKCDGLPLTLEVMGRYLQGRTTKVGVWEEVIYRLGKATPIHGNDRVWALLKVSYDGLSKEEQETFLEAAIFFPGKELDQFLMAWGNETAWENLVSRSMVKEVKLTKPREFLGDWTEYKTVWVHEHLRDLAKSIANDDMEFCGYGPGVYPVVNKLNANEVTATTKSLQLRGPNVPLPFRPTLELESLLRLKQLKYLELSSVKIEGRGKDVTRKKYEVQRLPKLKISHIRMDSLVVLKLTSCKVPEVFVEAFGKFTNLRIMSLVSLRDFQGLPQDFGNLPQLRRLILEGLPSLVLPKSFGSLFALKHLSFSEIGCLDLPESFGDLSSLETLTFYECSGLVSLPDSFGRNLTSLKELHIERCPFIKCLPQNFSKLSGLELCCIAECRRLKDLGDSFEDLSSLRKLTLRDLAIQRLPENFGHLSALEELALHCSKLKSLSDDFDQLTTLKDVVIASDELESLPENFSFLESLQKVGFCCPKLERLPDTLGLVTSLREVKLWRCWRLKNVPDSFGKPFSPKSGLLRGHESNELRRRAGECSQAKATEGIRLIIYDCPYLSDSALGSLGWVNVPSEDEHGFKSFKRHAWVVHIGIICSGCEMSPLEGLRYKSSTRLDYYDLCRNCFLKGDNDASEYTCIDRAVIPVLDPSRRCDERGVSSMKRPRKKSSTIFDCFLCHNCFQTQNACVFCGGDCGDHVLESPTDDSCHYYADVCQACFEASTVVSDTSSLLPRFQ